MGIEIDRAKVAADIVKVCVGRLREVLAAKMPTVVKRIQGEIERALDKSLEWGSLHDGNPMSLRNELGLADPSILIHIVDQMKQSVKHSKFEDTLKMNIYSFSAALEFMAVPSDYQDLLQLPQASYISYSKRKKGLTNLSDIAEGGTRIDWLKYLLLDGSRSIFPAHIIHYAKPISLSRAGHALMKPGGSYSIPQQWAGTPDNNFITRAFFAHKMNDRLGEIMREEILEAI